LIQNEELAVSTREKLKVLLMEVFLLSEDEFSFDLTRAQIQTWDSLGVVSLAVGVQETFGYHFAPEQAVALKSVADIIDILSQNGIPFDA
jgi:acyl carrier protein